MNLLYTTNEKFVSKVGASICSVLENNMNMDDITVYIIGQNISENSKKKFSDLGKKYGRIIEILELGSLKQYFTFDYDTLGWNPVVLARLLLDKFLPNNVEKILYLDGDTINRGSLEELWNTDLKGKVLGACIEATVNIEQRIQLGMTEIPYVNSGVLLIDLKRWRECDCEKRIISYYKEHDGKLFAPDQDAINGTLKREIYYLPPKYNFYNIYWFYPYKFLKKRMGDVWYYNQEVYQESLDNPLIIHYLGEERPWRKGNHHKYKEDYQKYFDKTPWRGEEEEKGWEVYFMCWDIFNFFMKPFPQVRYKIINGLIPTFMKWRKKQLAKERK